jgi:hypothetical protein
MTSNTAKATNHKPVNQGAIMFNAWLNIITLAKFINCDAFAVARYFNDEPACCLQSALITLPISQPHMHVILQ